MRQKQDMVRAAAGMILYRYPEAGYIEVLTGLRPSSGSIIAVFGDFVEPNDSVPMDAATRAAKKWTGNELNFQIKYPYPVASSGPEIEYKDIIAGIETIYSVSFPPVAITIFAGMITSGYPMCISADIWQFFFLSPTALKKAVLARGHAQII